MPPNCHIFALNLILESDDNLQEVSKAKQRKKTSRKQLRKRQPLASVHLTPEGLLRGDSDPVNRIS
jgi:hypothetical protein